MSHFPLRAPPAQVRTICHWRISVTPIPGMARPRMMSYGDAQNVRVELRVIGGNFLSLVEQGGITIYPLLFCSVVSLAVVIERGWTLTRGARSSRRLHALVFETVRENGVAEAAALCRHDKSPLAPVYRTALSHMNVDGGTRTQVAYRRLSAAMRGYKRFVWLLGTIGSLAPFIGLFGTVIGIIRAFENMAATGSGGFAVVAAGISEALVATAGGLLVGVISIFAYNAFMVRINGLSAELRDLADELLAALDQAAPQDGVRPRVVQSH
jgi:biopolymer transport protein ExbB